MPIKLARHKIKEVVTQQRSRSIFDTVEHTLEVYHELHRYTFIMNTGWIQGNDRELPSLRAKHAEYFM